MQKTGIARNAVTRTEVLVSLFVLALAAWFIVPALGARRAESRRAICLANLTTIGQAVSGYLERHDSRWPFVAKLRSVKIHSPAWPTLPEVLAGSVAGGRDVFRCPADSRTLTEDDPAEMRESYGVSTTYFETEGLSYGWHWGQPRGGHKIGEEALSGAKGFGFGRADQMLLSDFEPFHKGDGKGALNTLFADFKARTSAPNKD